MSERGVIGVARSIWDDPEFKPEPFTEREAFIWLVSEAAWKDRKVRGANGPVTLSRGEFCHSVRFMAVRWQWSKSRVARFISTLKKRDTIRDTIRDGNVVHYIKNYNKFQIVGLPHRDSEQDANWDSSGTAAGQQRDKLEEGEKGKKENNTVVRGDAADFRAHLSPDLDPERLEAIVKLRRKKRGQITALSARLFRKDAAACGMTLAEAVDTCISRNWITVKPEWLDNRQRAGPSSRQAELQAAFAETRKDFL